MAALDQDLLNQNLKKRRVCRFCLCRFCLTNIYMRDTRILTSAPLPIQIMAIASIEVFSNDGLPSFVCSDCTAIFEYSYQFKQMCKKADNLLRQYPLTGQWPKPLVKPVLDQRLAVQTPQAPTILNKQSTLPTRVPAEQSSTQESLLHKKLILNAAPSSDPAKIEQTDEESNKSSCLLKIENNDELSLDDILQLVAAEDVEEAEFVSIDELPVVVLDSGNKNKPKLLNKASGPILNKDVACEKEPRLSLPKIKKGQDGNMEVVAEILDYDAPYENETDPKNAEVIDTNVYPCPHCERSFPLVQLRDIHIGYHSRDRCFQCEECDKCFFSKYDLQRHVYTHNGAKPFKCSACDRAFSRDSLLQSHAKSHIDVPKYICVTCERPFISKETMEKHAERHRINRPFQCKICSKGFASKQGLERHEVIHSREQPYPCQYCDQSFSTTTKLTRHLTAHAGERAYPCKFCKKSYLLPHHLTRHMRSHKTAFDTTTVASFICSRCDECFENRDDLIRHSTEHTDDHNLSCPLCKENFDTIEMLTGHIREHSGGEAYACEFCDLIFMTAEKLQFHIDKDHAQEMEAYLEDDRVQAERMQTGSNNDSDMSEESLQTTVDEILYGDSLGNEKAKPKTTQVIKQEREHPKIISQVVVSASHKADNDSTDDNSLLIPLKQIIFEEADKKATAQPTIKSKIPQPSPQLRRKVASPAASNFPVRDKNQPSVITLKKTITTNKATEGNATQTQPSASPKSNQKVVTMKIGDKNVKVQKIRVTKAEVTAMAKEGRIKIKDGQIILTQEHK